MRLLEPRSHATFDLVVVALFVLASAVLGMSGVAAVVAFVVAGVHLVMTVATDFDFSPLALVPLRLHGWIELVVGAVLAVVPWGLTWVFDTTEQVFFGVAGAVIVVVRTCTRYGPDDPVGADRPEA